MLPAMPDQAPVSWTRTATDGNARAGVLHTPHGDVATPTFMAVGTQGALKGISFPQANDAGATIVLGNTYHLALRPGPELIHKLGGLHGFTGWDKPMLTDSGGYQVFSLAERRRIDESGVRFQSHLDGAELHLTPEESIRIQRLLGADIIMAFDECPASTADRDTIAAAVARTGRWLRRSRDACGPLATCLAATPPRLCMASTKVAWTRKCALNRSPTWWLSTCRATLLVASPLVNQPTNEIVF